MVKKYLFALRMIIITAIVFGLTVATFTTNFTSAEGPFVVTFDFDSGTPSLIEGQNTPLNQTSGGITASFTSLSDPNAFSVQSNTTTFFKLSQFSGNYLYDNKPFRNSLDIAFDQPVTRITFTFATIEYHGGPGVEPSNITVAAFMNSTSTPIGLATERATWPSGNSFPQGILSFNSDGQPFNLVRIELPYQGPKGAVDFLVDNIAITGTSAIPNNGSSSNTIFELPFMIILLTIVAAIFAIFLVKKLWGKIILY